VDETGVGCAPETSELGGSGAPDSDRTGLADPPEDWPAADLPVPAVTPREPQSPKARVWLVILKHLNIYTLWEFINTRTYYFN